MSVRLFVGNLDYSVSEAELRAHFSPVGQPAQVALPVDRETGRPRGFAFVEYADQAMAEEVIRRFNGQALKGRPLAISEARAREDRGPMAPRPPRPPYAGPSGGPPRAPRDPDFGGDAPRPGGGPAPSRDRRKMKPKQEQRGPKGPIRERGGGRVLDIDDPFDKDQEVVVEDFDDVATSQPRDDDEDDGRG